MKRRNGVWFISVATILGLIVIAGVVAALYSRHVRNSMQNLRVNTSAFDLGGIPDGQYPGSDQMMMAKADVLVTVEGGRITRIDVLNRSRYKADMEAVLQEVLTSQTANVDLVTGASASQACQKVALNAVQVALESAREQ